MNDAPVTCRFKIPSFEFQKKVLLQYWGKVGGSHRVTRLIADTQGIWLYGERGVLRYTPDGWEQFLCDHPLQSVEGWAAMQVIRELSNWEFDRAAAEAVYQIEPGEITFEDIRETNPSLLLHPSVKDELAWRFADGDMPKRSKGNRAECPDHERELLSLSPATGCYLANTTI